MTKYWSISIQRRKAKRGVENATTCTHPNCIQTLRSNPRLSRPLATFGLVMMMIKMMRMMPIIIVMTMMMVAMIMFYDDLLGVGGGGV